MFSFLEAKKSVNPEYLLNTSGKQNYSGTARQGLVLLGAASSRLTAKIEEGWPMLWLKEETYCALWLIYREKKIFIN